MRRLQELEARMLATPDRQISLTDPDARSMATSGRGSGMVGCTTGRERRITRWEHEAVLEAVQRRLDEHPEKMRQRRETVEHPFGRRSRCSHLQIPTPRPRRNRASD